MSTKKQIWLQVTRKELTGRNSAASSVVQHNHKAGAVPKYLKVRMVLRIMMVMSISILVMMVTMSCPAQPQGWCCAQVPQGGNLLMMLKILVVMRMKMTTIMINDGDSY